MLRKHTILILFILFFVLQIKAQFTDDFERYNYEQRISPQSLNWITWSEDPASGTGYITDEDGIVINTDENNNTKSFSGKQALLIDGNNRGSVPQDVILDLHNKSKGQWELSWQMYIPNRNKDAYYNFQENTPVNGSGNWAIQVYFNGSGNGSIEDDQGGSIVNFSYPWREWFQLRHFIDLDNDRIVIELISSSGTSEIYNASFLSNSQHLGGVDFYSISRNNKFFIDDVNFKSQIPIQDVYIWKNNRWEDINGMALTGEPDTSYEVILKEPFIVGSSTTTNTLSCLNLILENGSNLVVPSDKNVVISDNLSVASGIDITVKNNGSFVMLNNNAVIDIPNSNNFKYTRTSATMKSNDYTYWSSPVEDVLVSDFGSPYVFSYKTINFIDNYSGYGYPQTSGSPDRHDDNGDDWLYENQPNNIVPGKGYAVLNSSNSNVQTINFTGKPNNGYISVPVWLSGDSTNDEDDWNLIGNPYPSAIDAKVFINSNINLGGTLYFWTHNTVLGGESNTGPNDNNYNTEDYASFNLSGGVAANTGSEIPNGFIAAGQGFFMDVKDNGVISFNNDMRVINTVDENTQFFKPSMDKVKTESEIFQTNKIWVSISNDKGAFSQLLVAFLPGATNEFEPSYDGVRGGTDLKIKIYSILEDKELSIQGRLVLESETQIPLGYYITKPDSFGISIDKLLGQVSEEDFKIFLIDNELRITHDLKKSDYHFDLNESGTNNQRFSLQFVSDSEDIKGINKENNDLFITYSNPFYKIKTENKIKLVRVYDIMGRLLMQEKPHKQSFNLDAQNIKKGTILLFKVVLENGMVLSKKMIQY